MDIDLEPPPSAKRVRLVNGEQQHSDTPQQHQQQQQQTEPTCTEQRRTSIASMKPPPTPQKVRSQQADGKSFKKWMEEQFVAHYSICARLNMDLNSKQASWAMVCDVLNADTDANDCKSPAPNHVFACGIWLVGQVQAASAPLTTQQMASSGIAMSQIMNAAGVTILDFINNVKRFMKRVSHTNLHPDIEQKLAREVDLAQTDYTGMSLSYARYSEMFVAVFKFKNHRQPSAGRDDEAYGADIYNFIWTLFLHAKECMISDTNMTNKTFNLLLLWCFNFTIYQVSREFLAQIPDVVTKLRLSEQQLQTLSLDHASWEEFFLVCIKLLCAKLSVGFEEFCSNRDFFLSYIKEQFVDGKNWDYSAINSMNTIPILTNGFDMSGDKLKIARNLNVVEQKYQFLLHTRNARYDGRLFIVRKFVAGAPKKLMSTRKNAGFMSPAARSLRAELSRTGSLDSSMHSTPLSARSMNARKSQSSVNDDNYSTGERIKLILATQAEGPSAVLLGYLNACSPNPTQSIMDRARKILENFTKSVPDAAEYWHLAIRLYFHTLELMLRGEELRCGKKDFSDVMIDSKFHRALLSCSFELIRFCFKVSTISFEHILHAMDAQPFDFCTVIELCIRYDGRIMNWNLIRRLKEIEERIIEFDIWKSEAPLYVQIDEEIKRLTDRAAADSQFSPRKALNYVKNHKPQFTGDSEIVLEQAVHPPGITVVDMRAPATQTEIFFRKLYRVAHSRLLNMCTELGVDNCIAQKIWNTMTEIIINEHSWRLLFRRHLDTTILCVIYGMSRAAGGTPYTFKDLINAYRKQPQASEETWAKIRITESKTGDIINFYNEVFVPVIKPAIFDREGQKENASGSNTDNVIPIGLMSPRRIPTNKGQSAAGAANLAAIGSMTPRTLKLYNPGEGSAIKNMTSGGVERHMKSARKLNLH